MKKKTFTLTLTICLILALPCSVCFAQWTQTHLLSPRDQMGAARLDNKIYFAGGLGFVGHSNLLEIYDLETGNWDFSVFTSARSFPAVVAHDSKIFIAGGIVWQNTVHFSTVNIYNALDQEWTTNTLSSARMYIQAASVGDKVLFAGGYKVLSLTPPVLEFTNTVDIYDSSTGQWSVAELSEARAGMAVAVLGDKAFFAGGQTSLLTTSKRVDIYDAASDSWSIDSLSEARTLLAATVVGNKILIAGGTNSNNAQSTVVDVFDADTGNWTTASLSVGRSFTTMGATVCDTAYFIAGGGSDNELFSFTSATNVIDIYDSINDVWSTSTFPRAIINHTVVAGENKILVAGGFSFNNVLYDEVDIYTCQPMIVNGLEQVNESAGRFHIFPNPVNEILNFSLEPSPSHPTNGVLVKITDSRGRLVFSEMLANGDGKIHLPDIPRGMYFISALVEGNLYSAKFSK